MGRTIRTRPASSPGIGGIPFAERAVDRNPIPLLADPPEGCRRDLELIKHGLVGREIIILWTDSKWYDAIVLSYVPDNNSYRIVYRSDDGVENVKLDEVHWFAAPPRIEPPTHTVLDGAIVKYKYPVDGKWYLAMVFDSYDDGKHKIVYLSDFTVGTLDHNNWKVVRKSPCVLQDDGTLSTDLMMTDASAALEVIASFDMDE